MAGACTSSDAFYYLSFLLTVSEAKYTFAKSLISAFLLQPQYGLDRLLHLRLDPVFILYVALDLDCPLPSDFDMRFFWTHLSHLIWLNRVQDLVHVVPLTQLPDGLSAPDNCISHPEDDPDGILEQLWYETHPDAPRRTQNQRSPLTSTRPRDLLDYLKPGAGLLHLPESRIAFACPCSTSRPFADVYVAASPTGTGGYARTHAYSWALKESIFSIPYTTTTTASELHAILDAVCCWANRWEDYTVHFYVTSVPVAWHINGFADYSSEFPALLLLQRAACRWRFRIEAYYIGGCCERYSPHHMRRARELSTYDGHVSTDELPLDTVIMDSIMTDLEEVNACASSAPRRMTLTYPEVLQAREARSYLLMSRQPSYHHEHYHHSARREWEYRILLATTSEEDRPRSFTYLRPPIEMLNPDRSDEARAFDAPVAPNRLLHGHTLGGGAPQPSRRREVIQPVNAQARPRGARRDSEEDPDEIDGSRTGARAVSETLHGLGSPSVREHSEPPPGLMSRPMRRRGRAEEGLGYDAGERPAKRRRVRHVQRVEVIVKHEYPSWVGCTIM